MLELNHQLLFKNLKKEVLKRQVVLMKQIRLLNLQYRFVIVCELQYRLMSEKKMTIFGLI